MLAITERTRKKLWETTHDAYDVHKTQWQVLLDAIDGEGGFRSGAYLWQFPRELEDQFKNRQKQARYHNYAETVVGFYLRKCLAGITRQTTNAELEAWWADVDGAGTTIQEFMEQAASRALAVGHLGVLVDKTREPAAGPARADERARVVVAAYLPTAILDWRQDTLGKLTAVKLREDAPEPGILEDALRDEDRYQLLLWDRDEWARVPREDAIVQAPHDLGEVPFVVCAPFKSRRWPLIGQSVLGDGSLLRAVYNRQSEEDDVLRNQAFSVFVVSLPSDVTDVEQVKKEMGTEIGTTRALFVRGTGDYATPAMEVPAEIRANQQYIIRELFRIAHVPYDNDSRDAESAESKRADWEEISGILAGVCEELHRTELAIARLWCGWQAATPEAAETLFEAAKVNVTYPVRFFADVPLDDLKLDTESLKLEIGPTWDKQVKKAAVRRLRPQLDQATLDQIDKEIDSEAGVVEEPAPDFGRAGLFGGRVA